VLARAAAGADVAIITTSTAGLRETAKALGEAQSSPALAWACKGFETATGELPHQVVAAVLPGARHVAALSGPSFATEVAQGLPTALVCASNDARFAESTAAALNGPRLRIYSSTDVAGVELGGALKNVIAIAAGISDGLALGRNARAALVTRGLAEITRLGVTMGGKPETFAGLAGLGDLVLTCTGDLSRNREVGVRLARGQKLDAILADLGHVAEGVQSPQATHEPHQRHESMQMRSEQPPGQPPAPDLPTLDSGALPGFEVSAWHAMWAPKGLPKDVTDKLVAALQTALKDAKVVDRFASLGTAPVDQGLATPAALKSYLGTEVQRWDAVIKAAGVKGN